MLEIPVSKCPHCGTKLDAATPMCDPTHVPDPGSVSLCLRCCQWIVFDETLHLRKPSPEESVEFANDPMFQRLLAISIRVARQRASLQ
jgi:hypothetical protein